jgi:hypothetical protein
MSSGRQSGPTHLNQIRQLGELAHELSNSVGNVMNLLIRLQGELAPKEFATLTTALDLSYRSANTTRAVMASIYKMHAELLEQALEQGGATKGK